MLTLGSQENIITIASGLQHIFERIRVLDEFVIFHAHWTNMLLVCIDTLQKDISLEFQFCCFVRVIFTRIKLASGDFHKPCHDSNMTDVQKS